MSLEAKYVNALRRSTRLQDRYVCTFCTTADIIVGKRAFHLHLESVHQGQIERLCIELDIDPKSWHEANELRSRVAGPSIDIEPGGCETESKQAPKRLTIEPMEDSCVESERKQISLRRLPKHDGRAPPGDLRPPLLPKRPKASTDDGRHSGVMRSRVNPRRAVTNDGSADANRSTRTGTFQSNWGTDGQPTRTLFNPADVSAATAGQVTLPSRSAGPLSGSPTATTSAPERFTQERGVLPMPHALSPPSATKDRGIAMPVDPRWPDMLLQPDSRPISQEKLAAEVKSIYAGLTMVDSKCIHVDKAQALAMRKGETRISNDHWQALIALHRTLLDEHHNFFLASQHPSASPALRRLASKYSMPARMWKHGIHSFLELLRYRLPESLDFMISFINTAYQMMILLYDTVPAFKNTWIECLGDLGRYRMAIEDEDVRDRENWANVSRFWYTKAADRSPDVGRLYHHLAILARPNALQQLSLYARSLISVQIFNSARESILKLFMPVLGYANVEVTRVSRIDSEPCKAHAIPFTRDYISDHYSGRRKALCRLLQRRFPVATEWRSHEPSMSLGLFGDSSGLPEDDLIRGKAWSQMYFPPDWFHAADEDVDEENRIMEYASTMEKRAERVLNLAYRLSMHNHGIQYGTTGSAFFHDYSPTLSRQGSVIRNSIQTDDIDTFDLSKLISRLRKWLHDCASTPKWIPSFQIYFSNSLRVTRKLLLPSLFGPTLFSAQIRLAYAGPVGRNSGVLEYNPTIHHFRDRSNSDVVVSISAALLCCAGMIAGRRAREISLWSTLIFGVPLFLTLRLDEAFPDDLVWNVYKYFLASAATYLYVHHIPGRYGVLMLILTTMGTFVLAVIGSAMLGHQPGSVLTSLPPSLALSAVVAQKVTESVMPKNPPIDEETARNLSEQAIQTAQQTPDRVNNYTAYGQPTRVAPSHSTADAHVYELEANSLRDFWDTEAVQPVHNSIQPHASDWTEWLQQTQLRDQDPGSRHANTSQ